ncbi:coiled-coil domain-containing protein 43 isoform X1 [Ctenopharyngodon idella]|uniref:coiled-coil domain-containing protein 43 isoform X1 n=1 Tax=Ctenopharyngodon idella TaxID=7959 RepID=UPI00223263B5|nr:coiled-coil domain-containing protein 43 isoform X1 [Ctenopharyngodon idella]
MAAPHQIAGEFENWLNERLDSLEVDREVYGAYILGVLQEEENDEEQKDALQGILSAFLEEDTLEEVCQQILKQWTECGSRSAAKNQTEDEVQAIASLIEKQAQIVVKQKEVSEEAKKRKEALLAHLSQAHGSADPVWSSFLNVCTEDEEEEQTAVGIPIEKSLFKNTNVEDVLNRRKQQRDQAREDAQKKKEQDKMQREKDKLAKQERKDKEKKRTQKGERKR